MRTSVLLLALTTLLGAPLGAQEPPALAWDAGRAEHLLNRAGFGAGTAEVERAVALGPERTVDELMSVASWMEEPFYARKRADGDLDGLLHSLPEEEREKRKKELRAEDKAQLADFLDWWVGRMVAGEEPLRERMVLFWHGHFTSSMEVVKSSYEMIQQNHLFRRHALGSFRELLHAIVRDPAMLVYLDNVSSKKAHPNENFARELLELFTLGEGNYTEEDVREVARAFTGWTQRNGRFVFDKERHDRGEKRVLGRTGRLDGADVVALVLEQPACARHLAHTLLTHFEGVEPAPARLEQYAAHLRDSDWRIDAFLRRLFLDPAFYRGEVRAQRVTSPLDYLVGAARRLGGRPDPAILVREAGVLGQKLFHPPSVRGWEGGVAWASGSSLLLRGELVGTLLGRRFGAERLADAGDAMQPASDEEDDPSMEPVSGSMSDSAAKKERRDRAPADVRALRRLALHPRLNLTQRLNRVRPLDDAALAHALVAELLAVPAPPALAAHVTERLAAARAEHELGDAAWSSRPEIAEPLLRELAHEVLALPEAQLD